MYDRVHTTYVRKKMRLVVCTGRYRTIDWIHFNRHAHDRTVTVLRYRIHHCLALTKIIPDLFATMKLAVFASLLASAAAFAPARQVRVSLLENSLSS